MSVTDDPVSDWGSLHINRGDLGALDMFDQGGEGVLFRVSRMTGLHHQPLVFKEYRPGTVCALNHEVLERFALFARSLGRGVLMWLYERAAWPIWIIDDPHSAVGADEVVGVLMPLAPVRFMTRLHRSSGGARIVPAKFELLLNGRHFLDDVGIHISPRQKIRLLGSVAETVAFLHSHSMAVGDFSCKNILFALRPAPSCFFIDCDSMWRDGESALPPGETPEWELPPGEQLGTAAADVYKFALLALRMHTGAQHHRNPARLPDSTWGPLRTLIDHSLSSSPRDRPLITDWIGPLASAAAAASPGERPAVVGRSRRGPASGSPPGARRPPGVSVAPAPLHASGRDPAANPQDPSLLPPWPALDPVVNLLRRLLVRRPANPSILKLMLILLGLWTGCAAVFGLAVVAGMNPHHMSSITEIGLSGVFVLLALAAFALATTEPD